MNIHIFAFFNILCSKVDNSECLLGGKDEKEDNHLGLSLYCEGSNERRR